MLLYTKTFLALATLKPQQAGLSHHAATLAAQKANKAKVFLLLMKFF